LVCCRNQEVVSVLLQIRAQQGNGSRTRDA